MAKKIIAFIIFLISSIYITFPLIFHLGDYTTGLGDEMVIAWIQNWVIHALSTNPLSLLEANIYYPYHNSLAFSDLFLTSSILSFIPIKIIGEPIVAVNFTLISSLLFLGFFTYLLINYLTKDFFASLLGGLLIIYSPATLDKVVHLQVLAIQWVPLSILFFLMFIKSYKTRYFIFSLIFFILQTYNSFLPGYFIIFSYLIIGIYLWFYKRRVLCKILDRKNILLILLTGLFLLPAVLPYYKVSWEFNYIRDIRDAIYFSLQPEDFLYPSQYTKLQNVLLNLLSIRSYPKGTYFKPGYFGFVFTILSVLTIVYFIKAFKKKNLFFNSFSTISLLGIILSLGPALHLGGKTIHNPFPIILPYTLFYYVIPGFQGLRNSARWEMFFVLGMAVAIPLLLSGFLKKFIKKKRMVIYLVLIAGIIVEYNFPMKFVNVPQIKDFPAVYSWLSTTPKDTKIIELPIYNWNMWPGTQNELLRQYYSTLHFRKMVNGYSGFSPPPWQELVTSVLSEFPSDQSIGSLSKLGITYVIVHKDEYDLLNKNRVLIKGEKIKNGKEVLSFLLKSSELKFIKQFDQVYVSRLNK